MKKPSIALIACIENNKTASEALLLFASIRQFGGSLSQLPIYSFNPRGLGPLKQIHYDELNSLGVWHSDEVLNSVYRDYPPANKIYAAAHAEDVVAEEILVFLDSDSVILDNPHAFVLPPNVLAAATPVWLPGIGSHGPKDPAQMFWNKVRKVCGVHCQPPYIQARLTLEKVSFYCNAGLIVVQRSARIFARWLDCFERLWATPAIHQMLAYGSSQIGSYGPSFFLEQVALAAALMPIASNVRLLDHSYNCPLHNRPFLQNARLAKTFDLDTIVHFHYNQSFHEIGFLQSFDPPLNPKSPQYKWLAERLPLHPEIQPTKERQEFIIAFEQRMERWRKALSRLPITRT